MDGYLSHKIQVHYRLGSHPPITLIPDRRVGHYRGRPPVPPRAVWGCAESQRHNCRTFPQRRSSRSAPHLLAQPRKKCLGKALTQVGCFQYGAFGSRDWPSRTRLLTADSARYRVRDCILPASAIVVCESPYHFLRGCFVWWENRF